MFRLGSDVQKAARDYVRECALAGRSEELDGAFFLGSRRGRAWTYQGVRQVCRHVSEKVGFRFSPYMFRRLVATEMFARKVSLQSIQHHMGHTRTSTTLRYVQAEHEMNREGVGIMAGLMG